eukprot:Rmarinus@m.28354
MKFISLTTSLLIILLLCITECVEVNDVTSLSSEGCANPISYASSFFDPGILGAAGCLWTSDVFTAGKRCCDAVVAILSHNCSTLAWNGLAWQTEGSSQASMVYAAAHLCGVEVGQGYVEQEACGNGTLEGWERCDDGNDDHKDGCDSCWITPGYACSSPAGSSSVCRVCGEDCSALRREVCAADGGPCGVCAEGYREPLPGSRRCAPVLRVKYTMVDTPFGDIESRNCTFHDLGEIVEPLKFPTAAPYVSLVRSVMPYRSTPAAYGGCSLAGAVAMTRGEGQYVVSVVELPHPVYEKVNEVEFGGLYVPTRVVVFSDNVVPPVLRAHLQLFEVFAGSTALVSNVVIENPSHHEGGVAMVSGAVFVLEDSVIRGAKSLNLSALDAAYLQFRCDGDLFMVDGALALRNVEISEAVLEGVLGAHLCMSESRNAISVSGEIHLENVTVHDSWIRGHLINAKSTAVGEWNNVVFKRVHTESGSIVHSEGVVRARNVLFSNCTSSAPLFSQNGRNTVVLQDFIFADNQVSENQCIIYNAGLMRVANGTMTKNSPGPGRALLENRATIHLEGLVILDNTGAFLHNIAHAVMSGCYISGVGGADQYHWIYNRGALEVVRSYFNEADKSTSAVYVDSHDPFIVRDSSIPEEVVGTLQMASCDSILSPIYSPSTKACGTTANCTTSESPLVGVHCLCPENMFGDPTAYCSRKMSLYILPSNEIHLYFDKKPNEPSVYETEVLFLADGMGSLSWMFDNRTLPDWLSVDPFRGEFSSESECGDVALPVALYLDLESVTGANSNQRVEVMLNTTSAYPGEEIPGTSFPTTNITVHLNVKVHPSPRTSTVDFDRSRCLHDEIEYNPDVCVVQAGSLVFVHIHLRDFNNSGLGVGGDTFQVTSSSLTTFLILDQGNGSYTLEFEAPQTHFNLRVQLLEEDMLGSPLVYEVQCAGSDVWERSDSTDRMGSLSSDGGSGCGSGDGGSSYDGLIGTGRCVSPSFRLPQRIVAIALGGLFVGMSSLVFWLRKEFVFQWNSLHVEPLSITFWIVLDLMDIATDLSAWYYVNIDSSLAAYASWYLAGVTVAAVGACCSIASRVSTLLTVLSEGMRPEARSTALLPKPIYLSFEIGGFTTLVWYSDLYFVRGRLKRELRSSYMSILCLFVEDFPMQVLNTMILCIEGGGSTAVLLSLQISCLFVGFKITKIFHVQRCIHAMRRLQAQRSE